MNGDDDGVVEAFSTMRMLGASDDDLRVLVAKGFVKVLNDDLVTQIMDWKTNNLIKNDRYHPSIYKDLLLQVGDETVWNPIGTQMEPESSIGKSSIGKSSNNNGRFAKPTIDEVKEYCLERKNGVDAQRWFDYYESNGWKVGKNPMKDWKACIRTWERNTPKPKEEEDTSYREYNPEKYKSTNVLSNERIEELLKLRNKK